MCRDWGPVSGTRAKVYDRAVGRNVTTFTAGNKAGLLLTDEIRELFLATLRQTGRLSIAAGRCAIGVRTVGDWLQKGRAENAEEPYKSFADEVAATRADFLAVAARRMSQLAVGGVLNLPKYDKTNQLVRDKKTGEIEWEERFFPPNVNALAHVLDRIDPEPNLSPGPDLPLMPTLTDDARLARATAHFDLIVDALRLMGELGVDITQLMPATIETSAVPVETAKELLTAQMQEAKSEEPATPTAPPKPDPIDEAF